MKKRIAFLAILSTVAIVFNSCGNSKKLGCPSVSNSQVKQEVKA